MSRSRVISRTLLSSPSPPPCCQRCSGCCGRRQVLEPAPGSHSDRQDTQTDSLSCERGLQSEMNRKQQAGTSEPGLGRGGELRTNQKGGEGQACCLGREEAGLPGVVGLLQGVIRRASRSPLSGREADSGSPEAPSTGCWEERPPSPQRETRRRSDLTSHRRKGLEGRRVLGPRPWSVRPGKELACQLRNVRSHELR